jgi:CheY-like chemotaxis protein
VLMDVQLPDVDGVEALRRIRTDARTAYMPIVAVTAQAMDGDRERFLRAGFDAYLPKPVDVSELLGVLAAYCRADMSGSAREPAEN